MLLVPDRNCIGDVTQPDYRIPEAFTPDTVRFLIAPVPTKML